MELRQLNVSYLNNDNQLLFRETINECELVRLSERVVWHHTTFTVADIVRNFDDGSAQVKLSERIAPKEDTEPQKMLECVQVWAQNKGKLTIGKTYPILYERDAYSGYTTFFVLRDDGKKRGYRSDNTQFKIVEV